MTGSLFGGMHDFFHSSAWSAIRAAAIVFAILLWAATVYWVRKDARRRVARPSLVWLATLVGAVPPFLGPLVYMLFRPPEYLEDVRERQLEIRAIEKRLDERERQCSVCGAEVGADYLVCPVCTTRLRRACAKCGRPVEPSWQVCPYCETPVGSEPVPLPAKRQPRRTTRSSG
ncbi:MAG TPA: zinc ribbon domain-containing protein [Gaiellaceae bacterium]|nr:zinc ribbon domain-containing protein [Gaiellaceae bacterium]